MTPRQALLIAWTIFAATVVAAVVCLGLLARPAVAQAPDDVPVAQFACNDQGICVTTAAQLDRMMRLWYLMQQRILECPRGKEI